jgi:hypothetical protein
LCRPSGARVERIPSSHHFVVGYDAPSLRDFGLVAPSLQDFGPPEKYGGAFTQANSSRPVRNLPVIFHIIGMKRMWLLSASFDISEGSGLAPGYSTCLALNARSHGDWVMSLSNVVKGANQQFVFFDGLVPAHLQFLPVRLPFAANHSNFSGEVRTRGLL